VKRMRYNDAMVNGVASRRQRLSFRQWKCARIRETAAWQPAFPQQRRRERAVPCCSALSIQLACRMRQRSLKRRYTRVQCSAREAAACRRVPRSPTRGDAYGDVLRLKQ